VMRNYEGRLFRYPQVAEPAESGPAGGNGAGADGADGADGASRSHTLRVPEPAALLD
jgi:hypothetical protein